MLAWLTCKAPFGLLAKQCLAVGYTAKECSIDPDISFRDLWKGCEMSGTDISMLLLTHISDTVKESVRKCYWKDVTPTKAELFIDWQFENVTEAVTFSLKMSKSDLKSFCQWDVRLTNI